MKVHFAENCPDVSDPRKIRTKIRVSTTFWERCIINELGLTAPHQFRYLHEKRSSVLIRDSDEYPTAVVQYIYEVDYLFLNYFLKEYNPDLYLPPEVETKDFSLFYKKMFKLSRQVSSHSAVVDMTTCNDFEKGLKKMHVEIDQLIRLMSFLKHRLDVVKKTNPSILESLNFDEDICESTKKLLMSI